MNARSSKSMESRRFIACALLLVLMATAMRPAAAAVSEWSRKRPVYVRAALRDIDKSKLLGFRFVEDIGKDSAKVVETDEFVEWRFGITDPAHRLCQVAYLLVHYYVGHGAAPKIPHTPEVCYRQAGNQVTDIGGVDVPVPGLAVDGGDAPIISAKYVRMSHPQQPENKDICVVYVFCVNGDFLNDREWARIRLAMPWNRAVYFAKIECVTRVPRGDLDAALETCKTFMARVIPELIRTHFPTADDIARAEKE